METASNYPVGFFFEISFKGDDIAFQEVSGISEALRVEEITEGGENRFKYRLPTVSKGQNLVLKRALILDGSQLLAWCARTVGSGLVTSIETHDVSVKLLDAEGNILIKWTFFNAYPVKYSILDLEATANGLALETLELAYTYFDTSQDTSFSGLFDN